MRGLTAALAVLLALTLAGCGGDFRPPPPDPIPTAEPTPAHPIYDRIRAGRYERTTGDFGRSSYPYFYGYAVDQARSMSAEHIPHAAEGFIWPTDGRVTSFFSVTHRKGVDIAGPLLNGEWGIWPAVVAAAAGVVVTANAECTHNTYLTPDERARDPTAPIDDPAEPPLPCAAAGHGYGIYVDIRHDEATCPGSPTGEPRHFWTRYAHLDSIAADIQPGTRVRIGERLGVAGNTGYSTGTHLHFELRAFRGEPSPFDPYVDPALCILPWWLFVVPGEDGADAPPESTSPPVAATAQPDGVLPGLDRLRIAEEECAGYARDFYDAYHARSLRDGWDADDGALDGVITGFYTRERLRNHGQVVNVEHVVALHEAWCSEHRDATFGDWEPNLRPAEAGLNQAKSHYDPAEWVARGPGLTGLPGWCEYLRLHVQVKVERSMSADQPEVDFIRDSWTTHCAGSVNGAVAP